MPFLSYFKGISLFSCFSIFQYRFNGEQEKRNRILFNLSILSSF
ncbi:hypothetical protein HOLDEFILI_04237 [Holdemania filiformis DSM 12042]|uniref:Uncharacterized protein n=1 Tax=Holdemania filiformis DSM 12042 TaxID=545696 RepID=B9YEG3_9FIRM|nr:hypothetical protein HOLDEFILI_04237 [Holdemania filiformis DSM 12042]